MTIDEFFENANIFITGGTGFIGKVLIEKLLRSQSNIHNLFLLIRPKKGVDVNTRVEKKIFSQPIFESLKKTNPNYMNKIRVVEGDILEPGLGLSEENKEELRNEVNILFHCAASIDMKANLKYNVKHNIESVFELLELCREIKHLKSLVLVSTAYSNCNKRFIEEKIYDTPIRPELVIQMCKEMDDYALENVTKGILNGHPNTYTLSKSLMESTLPNYKDLPIVLFRPAIVTPSYLEPLPGWIDNYNGPVGAAYGSGLGILRVFHYGKNNKSNWVPVDYTTNALICAAQHGIEKRLMNGSQIMIYNYTCDKIKKEIRHYITTSNNIDVKLERCIWKQFQLIVENEYLFRCLRYLLHHVPALILDLLLALSGNKFRLSKLYQETIYPQIESMKFFCFNEWTFVEENVYTMWASLTEEEKQRYPFKPDNIDYHLLMRNFCIGVKVFIAKEKMENNHKALKRQKILSVIHYTFVTILLGCLIWLLYNIFNYIFGF